MSSISFATTADSRLKSATADVLFEVVGVNLAVDWAGVHTTGFVKYTSGASCLVLQGMRRYLCSSGMVSRI